MPAQNSPGLPQGAELDYVSSSTALNITATSTATAQSIIDGHAIWLPGDMDIWIEFFCPNVSATAGVAIQTIYDGSTDLGANNRFGQGATSGGGPWYTKHKITAPSAGLHTYHIKFWTNSSGGPTVNAGGGTYAPVWYRVSVA